MFYRLKSGIRLTGLIIKSEFNDISREVSRTLIDVIGTNLIKDMVISSEFEIQSHSYEGGTNLYNLEYFDSGMKKYFSDFDKWSKNYQSGPFELWITTSEDEFKEEPIEVIDEFYRELSSFVNMKFCPVPFLMIDIMSNGLDSFVFEECRFLEIIHSSYFTKNQSMKPHYRGEYPLSEDTRLFFTNLNNGETWRSILRKTDDLVGLSGDKSHVFLEGYCVDEHNVLTPCLGS
jgi:hypothetical protein